MLREVGATQGSRQDEPTPVEIDQVQGHYKEKETVKEKVRQKESQIGQHGVLEQEVPGQAEEEVKVKVEEKEKAKAKERKVKVKVKERREAREAKAAKAMIGADNVVRQDIGEMNAPIVWLTRRRPAPRLRQHRPTYRVHPQEVPQTKIEGFSGKSRCSTWELLRLRFLKRTRFVQVMKKLNPNGAEWYKSFV